MKGLRLLSALLACLAVVAAGLPELAFAWGSSAPPTAEPMAMGALCTQHCPSCEGMPCPPSAAGCVVACVGVVPTLGVTAFTLWIPPASNIVWPVRLAMLHGLSPPPDPQPPRF